MTEPGALAATPLVLPIGDKKYTVPPVTLALGLAIFNGEWTGKRGLDLYPILLGPMWQQMIDDDVPFDTAIRAGQAAVTDHQQGRDAALDVWANGIRPEDQAAQTAANPTTDPSSPDSLPSPSTATENKTRSRAVSRATTSRTS